MRCKWESRKNLGTSWSRSWRLLWWSLSASSSRIARNSAFVNPPSTSWFSGSRAGTITWRTQGIRAPFQEKDNGEHSHESSLSLSFRCTENGRPRGQPALWDESGECEWSSFWVRLSSTGLQRRVNKQILFAATIPELESGLCLTPPHVSKDIASAFHWLEQYQRV